MIQTIILGMILFILVIILGITIYHLFYYLPKKEIRSIINIEREGEDESIIINNGRDEFDKERQNAIEDLRKFALDKIGKNKENNKLKGSPGEIRVSGQESGPVTSGKEYIPYNLSERDKTILRMFNEK